MSTAEYYDFTGLVLGLDDEQTVYVQKSGESLEEETLNPPKLDALPALGCKDDTTFPCNVWHDLVNKGNFAYSVFMVTGVCAWVIVALSTYEYTSHARAGGVAVFGASSVVPVVKVKAFSSLTYFWYFFMEHVMVRSSYLIKI